MTDSHTPLEQDPAIYLRQQPSPTSPCHLLVEQLGSHDGDHAPMHMLAKVAVRLHGFVAWAARWDGREKQARRVGTFLASIALANILAVGAYWLHAHDARIKAEADAEVTKRQIQRLEGFVWDLRRVCGLDQKPITIVQSENHP